MAESTETVRETDHGSGAAGDPEPVQARPGLAGGGPAPRCPSPLSVAIVDDHTLFAEGLALVLGPAFGGQAEVVGAVGTVFAALDLLAGATPDVALVDLALPPPGGLELIRRARDRWPELHLLALSGVDDPEMAVAALAAGAEAFLPKTTRAEDLVPPILTAVQGWRVVPQAVLDHLVDRARRRGVSSIPDLDDEDRRLLLLVARGLEISAVAEALFVSERTAKRLVADLRARLGVCTRVEMAALAGRAGLLDDMAPGHHRG